MTENLLSTLRQLKKLKNNSNNTEIFFLKIADFIDLINTNSEIKDFGSHIFRQKFLNHEITKNIEVNNFLNLIDGSTFCNSLFENILQIIKSDNFSFLETIKTSWNSTQKPLSEFTSNDFFPKLARKKHLNEFVCNYISKLKTENNLNFSKNITEKIKQIITNILPEVINEILTFILLNSENYELWQSLKSNKERLKTLVKLKQKEDENLSPLDVVKQINTLNLSNLSNYQTKQQNLILKDLQSYLIKNLTDKNVKTIEINTLVKLWQQIFKQNPELPVTIFALNNFEILNQSLLKGIRNQKFTIFIPTCPDYSGTINDSGIFEFNFQTIREDIGVVTKKGFRFFEHIYRGLAGFGDTEKLLIFYQPLNFQIMEWKI